MKAPSVIGRLLPDALEILEQSGIRVIETTRTSAPRGAPSGPLRVVRERSRPEGIELVVAASLPPPEKRDESG
jgi:hypothetical protein